MVYDFAKTAVISKEPLNGAMSDVKASRVAGAGVYSQRKQIPPSTSRISIV